MSEWEAAQVLERHNKKLEKEDAAYKEQWEQVRAQIFWTVRMAGRISKVEKVTQIMPFPWDPAPEKKKRISKKERGRKAKELLLAFEDLKAGKFKPIKDLQDAQI